MALFGSMTAFFKVANLESEKFLLLEAMADGKHCLRNWTEQKNVTSRFHSVGDNFKKYETKFESTWNASIKSIEKVFKIAVTIIFCGICSSVTAIIISFRTFYIIYPFEISNKTR